MNKENIDNQVSNLINERANKSSSCSHNTSMNINNECTTLSIALELIFDIYGLISLPLTPILFILAFTNSSILLYVLFFITLIVFILTINSDLSDVV